MRDNLRPIGLSILAPIFGFFLLFLLEKGLDSEFPNMLSNVINFIIAAFFALVIFPRWLGIPIGKTETNVFLKRMGFYLPHQAWKHVLLGLILSACTLSGMLVASILTGKYTPDSSTISLEHTIFSLNPAFWEEFFYRGVIMIFLLMKTNSIKRAAAVQVLIFGLMHIKGTDLWSIVDIFSVMILAVAFTYTAWKTQALIAGIVFHFFHDTLIFFVQLPSDISTKNTENVVFFGLLWAMTAAGMLIVKFLTDKWNLRTEQPLYNLPEPEAGRAEVMAT